MPRGPVAGWRARLRAGPIPAIFAGALLVLRLNLLFAVAIVVVNALVPHAVLKDRVAHFVATGQIDAQNFPVDFTGNKLDRFSDCTAVSTNLFGAPGRGPVDLLRDADVVGERNGERDACEFLADVKAGADHPLPIVNYFRYWHGYQILTKPLLLLVDLTSLRIGSGVLYLVALGAFFVVTAMSGQGLLDAAFLAAGFALLTGAENLDGVMVHNLALLSTFAGGLAMHRAAAGASLSRLFLAGIAISACIAFIDENYVPPLAAMVLVIAAITARPPGESLRSLGQTFAVVLLAWACGYLGTMVLRVGVSALLLPDPMLGFRDFFAQLTFRMNGEVPWETHGFLSPLFRNAKFVVINPMFPVVLLGALILVATRLAAGWRFTLRARAPIYLLVALIPVFWYMTFRNYTVIHAFFMYRWAAFSVICCLGSVLACLRSSAAVQVSQTTELTEAA